MHKRAGDDAVDFSMSFEARIDAFTRCAPRLYSIFALIIASVISTAIKRRDEPAYFREAATFITLLISAARPAIMPHRSISPIFLRRSLQSAVVFYV